jgi:hypothetical protein
MLSRLQTVDDPELGELLRVAIDRHRRFYASHAGSDEELKIVRDVTDSYARIKLLDQQIEQTERRIDPTTNPSIPSEVRQEMLLAKADLESNRMVELANLRQVMGIIPAHAFGRRPVSQLKTWLALDVLDPETTVVYSGRQPFSEQNPRWTLVGVMPGIEAVCYVMDQPLDEKGRPFRVDIRRTVNGIEPSEQIQEEIVRSVRKLGLEMQAEVHLEDGTWRRPGLELFVLEHQVGTERRVRNGLPSLTGIIEPNDIGGYVERWLSQPQRLPAMLRLDYDPAGETTADRLAQTVAETAQRLGIAQFVKVKRTLHPPEPETLYMGQWEGTVEGETVRVTITRQSFEVLEIENGRITGRKGGRWSMEGDRIAVSIGNEMLTGTIDEAGTLFLVSGTERIAFRKKTD